MSVSTSLKETPDSARSPATEPTVRVFLDLRKTEFMDSAGMGVLHRAANWAGEEGWTLSLTGPRPNVRRVLSLTNLA